MNFFRSVFSDDPDPSTTSETEPRSPEKSLLKEGEESSDPKRSPVDDSSVDAGAWSFGGLIKTLSAKSESVIETYRRDLQEFGSGLKKEIEVAQGSLETVGHAFDEFGSSVLKGTAQIIAQGKDAILAIDQESDSDSSSNQNLSNQRSSNSKPYSRFDAQVRSLQGDTATYCEEPEDVGDYEKWKSQFVLNDKSEEIENLIEENGTIDNVHKKVVPNVVDNETFWFRYFYKVHKLKQAENVRANLVKRAIAREEEEDLSWDVDDDDDEEEEKEEGYNEINVGSKGDAVKSDVSNEVRGKAMKSEEVNVEHAADAALKDDLPEKEEVGGKESAEVVKKEVDPVKELNGGSSVGDDEKREKSSSVEELDGNNKGSNQKVQLEGGSGMNNKDQGLKLVAPEAKSDHGESSKDSDVSIVSTQPSMPEDEDLGWDEIEDLSIIEEKKPVVTQGGIVNQEEMRKRLSTAEDDEDLDWGTDTE
ncbi:BSD domain-containing protein 1 [Benincasa hispida]|uniref:BSD domain-containing protein 1 n=1 Tax=Benincasa hispida TaxID=102211 RepID=UPI0019014A18|nr:BSD domain-containing protein 1 [Benincasa hispida]